MSTRKTKQRGLGRGLSALMADVGENATAEDQPPRSADRLVPIERISPNPDQPRRSFNRQQLDDLAASIREKGIIQPLIVRPHPDRQEDFEIVAGERRWRAAQIAQVHEIPVLVREFDDTEVLEIAIIENVQRADLNPIEEATGYSQLMEKFGHTQERLAEVLGKSRSHIANSVRLLHLPEEIRALIVEERLTAGHARALITADDPVALARKVIAKGLSVRATEKLAKAAVGNIFAEQGKTKRPGGAEKDADTKALEGDLSANLGMKVSLSHLPGQESGQMIITYESFDQLDILCRMLTAQQ